MITRYTKSKFEEDYSPNLLDNVRYKFTQNGKTGVLKILDPIGIDDFDSLFDQYIEVSKGFIVVFDISNRETFDKCPEII